MYLDIFMNFRFALMMLRITLILCASLLLFYAQVELALVLFLLVIGIYILQDFVFSRYVRLGFIVSADLHK